MESRGKCRGVQVVWKIRVRGWGWLAAVGMVGCAMLGTGCMSKHSLLSRHFKPQYIVTAEYYRQAPQVVGILPFGSRAQRPVDLERAQICRRVFYQHFALLDFEDVEMSRFDKVVLGRKEESAKALEKLGGLIRGIDLLGMTSLLELPAVFANDPIRQNEASELVNKAVKAFRSDAYVMGISRSYGRIYAVAFSTLGISTRVELRSAKNGALLWRAEGKHRNYQFPISLNPIDIPYLLWYTWLNSRGVAMDMMAYKLYRDLSATLPYLEAPAQVLVKTTRSRTRLFRGPTIWFWLPQRLVPEGETFGFLMENSGWYQVLADDGEILWVENDDAVLVDELGRPIGPERDLADKLP